MAEAVDPADSAGQPSYPAAGGDSLAPDKITVFSKYFGYDVGGAEQSTLAMLRDAEERGMTIEVVLVENVRNFGADRLRSQLPVRWRVRRLSLNAEISRFKYVNYYLNKRMIARFFSRLAEGGELLSYGLFAPAALNAYSGPTAYVVRDELGLGLDVNYYRGLRRVGRDLYAATELPMHRRWRQELEQAVHRATRVIANSHFMADRVIERFGRSDVKVVYPEVDVTDLSRRVGEMGSRAAVRDGINVVAVGDNVLKGGDIVRGLAARCPEMSFHLFDRRYREVSRQGNLTLHPWVADPVEVYRLADIVLVPSRWQEAYSRVAHEAASLGIPVLASNLGGIPEALQRAGAGRNYALVHDPDEWSEWVDKLRSLEPVGQ